MQFRGTRVTPGDPSTLMQKSPAELDAALAEVAASKVEAANGAGDTAGPPPAGTTPPRPA